MKLDLAQIGPIWSFDPNFPMSTPGRSFSNHHPPSPPPPHHPRAARARSHCQSKDSKIMNKCTSCIRQDVLTTG